MRELFLLRESAPTAKSVEDVRQTEFVPQIQKSWNRWRVVPRLDDLLFAD